jgi:REP element-mobilizing transposase RayT
MKPIKLEQGKFYHLYNRGNNSEPIFFETKNYEHFLMLMARYIEPIADIYAWALMKNHFHLLVYLKTESEIDFNKLEYTSTDKPKKFSASKQFSNWFSAYTLAMNKMYGRTGSLFEKSIERKWVDNEKYLLNLIYYINYNPVKHRIVEHPVEYPWCSYIGTLSNKPTKIQRDRILKIFGNRNVFEKYHQTSQNIEDIEHLIIEET